MPRVAATFRLAVLALGSTMVMACGDSGETKTTSSAPSRSTRSDAPTRSTRSDATPTPRRHRDAPAKGHGPAAVALQHITSECVHRHQAGRRVGAPTPGFRRAVRVIVRAFAADPNGTFDASSGRSTSLHDTLVRIGTALGVAPPKGCGGRGTGAIVLDIRRALVRAHTQ